MQKLTINYPLLLLCPSPLSGLSFTLRFNVIVYIHIVHFLLASPIS